MVIIRMYIYFLFLCTEGLFLPCKVVSQYSLIIYSLFLRKVPTPWYTILFVMFFISTNVSSGIFQLILQTRFILLWGLLKCLHHSCEFLDFESPGSPSFSSTYSQTKSIAYVLLPALDSLPIRMQSLYPSTLVACMKHTLLPAGLQTCPGFSRVMTLIRESQNQDRDHLKLRADTLLRISQYVIVLITEELENI